MVIPMWQFLTIALVLWMQTRRIDCTMETIRPLGKVKIQPIYFNRSLDQGKRVAITRCVFHGPRDLTATFSNIDGTFEKGKDIDKDTSEYEAVFQASIDVLSFCGIRLHSASTFESLTAEFNLPETNKSMQTNFPFSSCKFEVKRSSDEQTTNYSAIAKECGNMANNEMYLYFPVNLTDWNSAKYAQVSDGVYRLPETTANIVMKTGKLANDGVDINSVHFSTIIFYTNISPMSHFLTWLFRLM
ncbi:uncharacterized protein LOC134259633 isoform X2 [Saccostrea cucullata]|uniref:uncharacterized protein LOC134259633 isoform X2 n=1 Tax=Saccostrea cuccullata TaxID=36930 RepID=UPI002ED07062